MSQNNLDNMDDMEQDIYEHLTEEEKNILDGANKNKINLLDITVFDAFANTIAYAMSGLTRLQVRQYNPILIEDIKDKDEINEIEKAASICLTVNANDEQNENRDGNDNGVRDGRVGEYVETLKTKSEWQNASPYAFLLVIKNAIDNPSVYKIRLTKNKKFIKAIELFKDMGDQYIWLLEEYRLFYQI